MNNLMVTLGIGQDSMSRTFATLIFGLFFLALAGLIVRFVRILISSNSEVSLDNLEDDGTYGKAFKAYLSNHYVDDKGNTRSLVSFSEYVDTAEVAPVWFPTPRLSTSIPSILTILGILGTFIVLVDSLGNLNTNAGDMTVQIGKLLTGTKTAYFKSVWGVGCSLIYSFVERIFSDFNQRNVSKVVVCVDAKYPILTSESVSFKLYNETVATKKAIITLTESIRPTTDSDIKDPNTVFGLITGVTTAIDKLASNFNGFEATMKDVANKGRESQNEAIRELLKDVVEEFRDQMVNGVKEGLQQLTNAMDESSERLNQFGQTTSDVSDKLNNTVDKLVDIHGELNRNIDGINESLESVSETMDAAKGTTDRCLAILKEMADGTEVNQEAIQQLYMTVRKLEPTIAAVQQCQLRSEENVAKMAQAVREIDETLTGFTDKLDTNLTSFTSEFSGISDTLTASGQDFANQVANHVQAYCSALDTSLSTAVTSLKRGISELEDGIVPGAESLSKSVSTVSQTVTQLNDALTRLQPSGDKLKQLTEVLAIIQSVELSKDKSSQ
jgi:archaellum component FlaC